MATDIILEESTVRIVGGDLRVEDENGNNPIRLDGKRGLVRADRSTVRKQATITLLHPAPVPGTNQTSVADLPVVEMRSAEDRGGQVVIRGKPPSPMSLQNFLAMPAAIMLTTDEEGRGKIIIPVPGDVIVGGISMLDMSQRLKALEEQVENLSNGA